MPAIRDNKVKSKLKRGETVTVISSYDFDSPNMIDYLGQFGFDAVWIEGEHGASDFADIPDMTRACDLWGMTSIVRVNHNNAGVIYRTFDVGAQGIVVPHVNTAEEAKAVVNASKFAPIGSRGMNVGRQGYGVPDYAARTNDETLIVICIEDIVAVENLRDILSVDHVDVFFVAPGDLAQSMGYLDQHEHPDVLKVGDATMDQIIDAGKVAGAYCSDSTVEGYINRGARFLYTEWASWVDRGARSYLSKFASLLQ